MTRGGYLRDRRGMRRKRQGIEGDIVEVKLEDIESILVWDLMTIKEDDLAGLEIVINIISLVTIAFLVRFGILFP
jgi:hypothetical protein